VKTYVSPLRIDLHVHSCYSDDSRTTLKELVKYAQRNGLDGVAVTDHDTVRGARILAKQKDLIVIPGIEVSSLHGHILGLNITEPIQPNLDITETAEQIKRLGGIAVVAHPSVVIKTGLGSKITSASKIDAVEVINASAFPFFLSTYLARRLAQNLRLPQTGGSDAHYPEEIGNAYTLIDSDSNKNDIVEAIRKGETSPCGKPISVMRRMGRVSEAVQMRLRRPQSSKSSI
jgi:predicted metal-dependent phosphoesterase TrpH